MSNASKNVKPPVPTVAARVHGILKAPELKIVLRDRSRSRDGSIKWDEESIAEHDKLRGTRKKILEPNTPFYNPQDSVELAHEGDWRKDNDSQDDHRQSDDIADKKATYAFPGRTVSPAELRQRLELLRLRQQQMGTSEQLADDLLGAQSYDEDTHAREFAQRRKAHYNEYRVLKQMRSSGSLGSNPESDDSDEVAADVVPDDAN